MPKTKISEFSSTPGNNTDIDGINIAEGCAPSGINDAIRELMSQLKDWQAGTSNDPMVIGSSGSLTLSYGTANGVPYLNGSKVLTTGSALTFDGTNLGIGTSSPAARLHAYGTSGAVTVMAEGAVGSSAYGRLEMRGRPAGAGQSAGYIVAASTAGGQAATNIGAIDIAQEGASGNASFMAFSTHNGTSLAEDMRLDSRGNLGLGVTPSAWGGSNRGVIDLGTAGAVMASTSVGTATSYNAYFDGTNWVYKLSGSGATRYTSTSTTHAWYTAPSGTAGDAISFTQAMTLDASGNLLLGTTSSDGSRLRVYGAYQTLGDGAYEGLIGKASSLVSGGGLGDFAVRSAANLVFATNGGTERMRIDTSGNVGIGTSSPGSRLDVAGSISSVNGYQDNLVLQNALSGSRNRFILGQSLTSGAYIYTDAPGGVAAALPLTFWTAGTERARIDSIGNLLVGTTSVPSPGGVSGQGLIVNNSSNNGAWSVFQSTGASSNRGIAVSYTGASPNDGFNEAYFFRDSTATRFLVKSNGGINNYSANNTNLSDRREKTNFAPAGEYLSKICAIPVQTFNYADQNLEQDPGLTLGVVAQDVQAVAPELVTEANWGTEEEPKMRLSIYQTDLQYALMKCIQEQQAIIEQLKADVAALKGN